MTNKIDVVCALFVVILVIGGSFFPEIPQFYFPFLLIFISILIFQCIKSIFGALSSKWLKITYSLFLTSLILGISNYAWYIELDRIYLSGKVWEKAWNLWGLYSIRDFEMFLRVIPFLTLTLLIINCILFIRNKEQQCIVKWDRSKANILLLTLLMLTIIYIVATYLLFSSSRSKILVTIVRMYASGSFQIAKSISPALFLSYGFSLFLGWILTKIFLKPTKYDICERKTGTPIHTNIKTGHSKNTTPLKVLWKKRGIGQSFKLFISWPCSEVFASTINYSMCWKKVVSTPWSVVR